MLVHIPIHINVIFIPIFQISPEVKMTLHNRRIDIKVSKLEKNAVKSSCIKNSGDDKNTLGTGTTAEESFDETNTSKRPAHRLPWPRSAKRNSTSKQSENKNDLRVSSLYSGVEKDSQNTLETDNLCSANSPLLSKVEALVLYEKVEVGVINLDCGSYTV